MTNPAYAITSNGVIIPYDKLDFYVVNHKFKQKDVFVMGDASKEYYPKAKFEVSTSGIVRIFDKLQYK